MSISKLKRLSRLKKKEGDIPFAPKDPDDPVGSNEVKVEDDEEVNKPNISLSEQYATKKKLQRDRVKKPALTVALEDWFKTQIYLVYGEGVITKRWGVKERTLAKKLVNNYGKDMTEQVIKSYIEAWPSMVMQSRNRLFGLPTINFLWSAQDRFFGAHQVTQPDVANVRKDEYRDVEDDDDSW